MTSVTEHLSSRMGGFDIWTLPKRYRRAMALCYAMDARRIWIDSLCIIQVSSATGGAIHSSPDFDRSRIQLKTAN